MQIDFEPARKNTVCSTFAILLSVLTFTGFALLLASWWTPNLKPYLAQARQTTVLPMEYFKPEPVEKALYVYAVLLSPFLLLLYYWLAGRLWAALPGSARGQAYWASVIMAASLAALLFVADFSAVSPFKGFTNLRVFCSALFFYRFPLVFAFLFPALALFFFIGLPKITGRLRKSVAILSHACLVFLTLLLFFYFLFTPAAVHSNTGEYYTHFAAVFDSQAQVAAGHPLLVDGFRNTYGLYAQMLQPLFWLTGLTVFKFSLTMALMMAATIVCLFFTLRMAVRSRAVFLLGFIATVYFERIYLYFAPFPERAYQYCPIRTFFPAVSLLLVAAYLLKDRKKLYLPIFAVNSLGVLWNFELGMVCWLSWLILLVYEEITARRGMALVWRVSAHLLTGAAFLAATFFGYSLIIRIVYGQFPDFGLGFGTLFTFSNLGGGMLPMPLWNPWHLLALTCLAGLLYGVRAFLNRETTPRASLIVYIAVLGAGLFGYYQGRSHDNCLMTVLKPTILLLVLFMDEAWVSFQADHGANRLHPLRVLFLLLALFILSQGVLSLTSGVPAFCKVIREDLIEAPAHPLGNAVQNIAFLKRHAAPGESVLIISDYQGIYHAESKTSSPYPIGTVDITTRAEMDRLLKTLFSAPPRKIFWEPHSFIVPFMQEDINEMIANAVTAGRFRVLDKNGSIYLLEPAAADGTPAPAGGKGN